MKKYIAYTQADWNAEKFYITDSYDELVIVEAGTAAEAEEIFTEIVHETSIYNRKETIEWLERNPIFVEEV